MWECTCQYLVCIWDPLYLPGLVSNTFHQIQLQIFSFWKYKIAICRIKIYQIRIQPNKYKYTLDELRKTWWYRDLEDWICHPWQFWIFAACICHYCRGLVELSSAPSTKWASSWFSAVRVLRAGPGRFGELRMKLNSLGLLVEKPSDLLTHHFRWEHLEFLDEHLSNITHSMSSLHHISLKLRSKVVAEVNMSSFDSCWDASPASQWSPSGSSSFYSHRSERVQLLRVIILWHKVPPGLLWHDFHIASYLSVAVSDGDNIPERSRIMFVL